MHLEGHREKTILVLPVGRIKRRGGGVSQTAKLRIAADADDLDVFCTLRVHLEPPADGIRMRVVLLRQRLVDHRNRSRAGRVRLLKAAPRNHRDTKRLEELVTDKIKIRNLRL